MNMKKIAILALSLCMIAAIAVTGTIAYFTDVDAENNVFTFGNVDIEIDEKFEQNSHLMPDEENRTQKEVYVKNEGTEPAYIRIHYAIPSALVDANINSWNDMLHVNMSKASIQAGEWSWLPAYNKGGAGWTDNGKANNNTYTTTIDEVEHTVWVVTYTTAVAAEGTTATPAISQVYLDKNIEATGNVDGSVTYTKPNFTTSDRDPKKAAGDMTYTVSTKNEEGKLAAQLIKIVAEGTQVDSFDDAYDALNTAFGVPGTYNPWAE